MVYEPPLNRTSEIDGLCMEIAEPAPRECRSGSQGPQRAGHGTARIRETRQVVVEQPFLPFLSPAATPIRQLAPTHPPIWRHFNHANGVMSSGCLAALRRPGHPVVLSQSVASAA